MTLPMNTWYRNAHGFWHYNTEADHYWLTPLDGRWHLGRSGETLTCWRSLDEAKQAAPAFIRELESDDPKPMTLAAAVVSARDNAERVRTVGGLFGQVAVWADDKFRWESSGRPVLITPEILDSRWLVCR